MVHEKILRVIDFSLVPFSFTVLGKVLGLFWVFRALNIDWGVADFANSVVSVTPLVYARDVTLVATYSNLVLFIVILVGTLLQFLFNVVVLINQNQGRLVKSALFLRRFHLFSNVENLRIRLFSWTAFLCLVAVYIAIDAIAQKTSWWLAGFSLIVTALVTASALQFKPKLRTKNA